MARIRLRRMMSKVKTSRINRAAPGAPVDVTEYCRDFANWPRSWMGLEKDLPPGEALIICFRPFIEHLASRGFSAKTIRKHVDNLWSLGGEIIRDLHYDSWLRRKPTEQLLRNAVHEYGGPAIHNASDEQQRSVNSTCRKLHRFLTQSRL